MAIFNSYVKLPEGSSVIFNSNLLHLLVYQWVRIFFLRCHPTKSMPFPDKITTRNSAQRGLVEDIRCPWRMSGTRIIAQAWEFDGISLRDWGSIASTNLFKGLHDFQPWRQTFNTGHCYRFSFLPNPISIRSCSRLKYSVKLRILWLIIMFPTIFDGHMLVVDLPNWHNPHCNICKVSLRYCQMWLALGNPLESIGKSWENHIVSVKNSRFFHDFPMDFPWSWLITFQGIPIFVNFQSLKSSHL